MNDGYTFGICVLCEVGRGATARLSFGFVNALAFEHVVVPVSRGRKNTLFAAHDWPWTSTGLLAICENDGGRQPGGGITQHSKHKAGNGCNGCPNFSPQKKREGKRRAAWWRLLAPSTPLAAPLRHARLRLELACKDRVCPTCCRLSGRKRINLCYQPGRPSSVADTGLSRGSGEPTSRFLMTIML